MRAPWDARAETAAAAVAAVAPGRLMVTLTTMPDAARSRREPADWCVCVLVCVLVRVWVGWGGEEGRKRGRGGEGRRS